MLKGFQLVKWQHDHTFNQVNVTVCSCLTHMNTRLVELCLSVVKRIDRNDSNTLNMTGMQDTVFSLVSVVMVTEGRTELAVRAEFLTLQAVVHWVGAHDVQSVVGL